MRAGQWDAVYARQSVEKKDSLSISGQIALCRRAAEGRELKVYQDCGYSGKNTERPAFQRLLKDVRADRIGTLYVYRLDRFSRSVADFGQLWEILQAHRVEFCSVNERFDTATPMGRAMLHIIMVFAQLERETTAERVRDNYYRRLALGAWPGGPAPYGFDVGRAKNAGGKEIPTLLPNGDAEQVRQLFQAYGDEECSLGKLAKSLTRAGVHGPRRAEWDSVTLSRILHNPVYVMADEQVRLYYLSRGAEIAAPPEAFDGAHGAMLAGRRNRGQRGAPPAQAQRLTVLNSAGLVPPALWLRCQEKLERNRQIGNSGKGTHTWLSGLLKCAKCGYSLKILEEGPRRRMVCSGRYNLAHCNAAIGADLGALEQAAAEEIEGLLQACPAEPSEDEARDALAEQLAELARKADRLVDAFAESRELDRRYLQRALGRLEAERRQLLETHKRAARSGRPAERLRFADLDFAGKKLVARQYIDRIEVGETGAEIFWKV